MSEEERQKIIKAMDNATAISAHGVIIIPEEKWADIIRATYKNR